jgi:murein L,D-transpeptidase YcbB/YkuD
MNYRLYFTINHQSEYIVVNVLSAEAEYYKNDKLVIGMRVVVGQKANPTPLFASYITSLVTFPHWNVPQSIAVKELIPKVQKDKNYLEQNGFEVVDAKGIEVDDSELHWKTYSENNFPFFFRQSTGGDNALGVLKFNLKNPYSVFLHATSNQAVFTRTNRFLSHGCIRLEKPFELANALLENKLNVEELKTAKKDTESNTIQLPHKIPTYILYMPIQIVDNRITFLFDEYGLIKGF